MALEQKLQLKLAQKLVMTPTLQQAIKLLQLSRLELEQALTQELQVNPLLEVSEEGAGDDAAAGSGDQQANEEAAGDDEAGAFSEVELEALFSNYLHDAPTVAATWEEGEEAPFDNSPGPQASLFDDLCDQLRLSEVPAKLVSTAEFVIGNIEPDGYLRVGNDELAEQLGVEVEVVEEAVRLVQSLEPPGIAARSLQECFLLQLDRWEPADDSEAETLALARRLIAEAFDDLLHQRWDKIRQKLDVSVEEIKQVLEIVRRLEVHPGARLGPSDNQPIEPDVTVYKQRGQWVVSQNDDGMPRLRLSPRYLRMLQSRSLDGEATGFLRERMRAALWFLRSVEQRQSTILKVANAIVRRQEGFLERGIAGLKPLVLRDIADDIGMHESTVSRVVSNKYMATPRGIFPLKFFFHSAISHAVQGDISSVVVKERIRELIEAEDAEKPLSDARIARQLNRLGIRIARRTVAKYREELAIPSSEQRRRALR